MLQVRARLLPLRLTLLPLLLLLHVRLHLTQRLTTPQGNV